jgi:putative PIN family toxin of toxin-antitoxin system
MKVFLDSSVIIAALLSTTGASAKILTLSEGGIVEAYVTDEVVEEVLDVVQRKFPEALSLVKELLKKTCTCIKATKGKMKGNPQEWIKDPKDVKILLGAKQCKVDVLLTLDLKDFIKDKSVAEKSQLKIQTPGDFLNEVFAQFTSL